MAPNTSIETFGRNFECLIEVKEEHLLDTHQVGCHEASYRLSLTTSKAGGGAPGTQILQRGEAQQAPSRIEELARDSFLQFRDEWVRSRARDIRQAGSISFKTCSEDTASITALNEFYRWRVFEAFKPEHRDEKEMEIGMKRGLRDFGSFPKDVSVAEKLHMCRIVCREKDRRVFRETCRRRARSRV